MVLVAEHGSRMHDLDRASSRSRGDLLEVDLANRHSTAARQIGYQVAGLILNRRRFIALAEKTVILWGGACRVVRRVAVDDRLVGGAVVCAPLERQPATSVVICVQRDELKPVCVDLGAGENQRAAHSKFLYRGSGLA